MEWRLEPSYFEMILAFMHQTDAQHPPAMGQALGSRMGQDTDTPVESCMVLCWRCWQGRGASLPLDRGR